MNKAMRRVLFFNSCALAFGPPLFAPRHASAQDEAPPPPAPPLATAQPPSAAPPPAAPAEAPPPPKETEEDKYKHINMGIWMRIDGRAQNPKKPDNLDKVTSTGELQLHFSNQMRKTIKWTANMIAAYGNGSINGAGSVAILDLIAQYEPDDAFNIWVGRLLVPSDRSNFAGPYFMAPWYYPLLGGPKQGPIGRNNGAVVWGQFGGGLFKYYAGAFNLHDPTLRPFYSGRLNLNLLNPEPGYYHSSTYYGKDILALGVGGQYQKNEPAAAAGGTPDDYALVNADLLYEKVLGGAGVVDLEGAFFKYYGNNQAYDLSYFALASYLTPQIGGYGKLQPLARIQQAKPKDVGGVTSDTETIFDGQVGYVVDSYATRGVVGFQHTDVGGKTGNAVFAGVQLIK